MDTFDTVRRSRTSCVTSCITERLPAALEKTGAASQHNTHAGTSSALSLSVSVSIYFLISLITRRIARHFRVRLSFGLRNVFARAVMPVFDKVYHFDPGLWVRPFHLFSKSKKEVEVELKKPILVEPTRLATLPPHGPGSFTNKPPGKLETGHTGYPGGACSLIWPNLSVQEFSTEKCLSLPP